MPLLLSLTIGLTVGVLAWRIRPRRERVTWVTSALLGMFGALLGGYFGQLLGWNDTGRQAGLLVSALSAIAILLAYHACVGRGACR